MALGEASSQATYPAPGSPFKLRRDGAKTRKRLTARANHIDTFTVDEVIGSMRENSYDVVKIDCLENGYGYVR